MFARYHQDVDKHLKPGKILIIYGARRVGKTTLLTEFLKENGGKYKYKLVSGDNIKVHPVLNSGDFELIQEFCAGYELIVIDEAQNIEEIGKGLKIIIDNNPEIRVIATGSSSFDLASKVGEPLVGRKTTITMYPLSQLELRKQYNNHELKEKLENFLLYGSYPEVLTLETANEKIEYLNELAGAYLYKDILSLYSIKNPATLQKLLALLAFQVGSEVSMNELSGALGIDSKTVERYLDLLEKTFVIVKLSGFSRNLRNEITSKNKYYFVDLGIRNSIISNFNHLDLRNDKGQLWENFLFIERVKHNAYTGHHANMYFWRTYDQKEVDLIEEYDGMLHAYEFKWKQGKGNGKAFLAAYPDAEFVTIDNQNYMKFVSNT